MKVFRYSLDSHQVNEFFKPVRSKVNVVKLLMKSIKYILSGIQASDDDKVGELILVVSKMSRLFYISEKKSFSIAFPFSVKEISESIEFSSKYVAFIDSKTTSDVISILSNEDAFNHESAMEFMIPIEELCESEKSFWGLILNLLMYEDGYIRYDLDPDRVNGDKHPLHHLDIFYSSNSTFKVGLRSGLEQEVFIDFLSIETDCHYLERR